MKEPYQPGAKGVAPVVVSCGCCDCTLSYTLIKYGVFNSKGLLLITQEVLSNLVSPRFARDIVISSLPSCHRLYMRFLPC